MRLWTLHPGHLDRQGLLAVWREGLLAQKVLQGRTQGYRSHPQLLRFRETPRPLAFISAYLHAVAEEADRRGYSFQRDKIATAPTRRNIWETQGQLRFEWTHLMEKLKKRSPAWHRLAGKPSAHPLFRIVPGGIRRWEKGVCARSCIQNAFNVN